jgi:diacylglycerol kinase (ATP)
MIPAGLWIGETAVQKALLVLTCLIVLTVELLNSAIEAVVDRLGKDYHPLSKRAKDMGSAAVFISLIATLAAWLIIIVARFFL